MQASLLQSRRGPDRAPFYASRRGFLTFLSFVFVLVLTLRIQLHSRAAANSGGGKLEGRRWLFNEGGR